MVKFKTTIILECEGDTSKCPKDSTREVDGVIELSQDYRYDCDDTVTSFMPIYEIPKHWTGKRFGRSDVRLRCSHCTHDAHGRVYGQRIVDRRDFRANLGRATKDD